MKMPSCQLEEEATDQTGDCLIIKNPADHDSSVYITAGSSENL